MKNRASLLKAAAWLIIPALWLATMAYLVVKQIPRDKAAELEAAAEPLFANVEVVDRWRDIEEYALLSSAGSVIGASRTLLERASESPRPEYRHHFHLQAWPRLLGMRQNVAVAGVAQLDNNFALVSFSAETTLPLMRLSIQGVTSGSELLLETGTAGGEPARSRVAMPRPLAMPESLRPALTHRLVIRPGNRMIVPAFDPLLGAEGGHMTVTVGKQDYVEIHGEKKHAYPVDFQMKNVSTRAWMTAGGRTLRRELPANLVMDTVTSSVALAQAPGLGAEPTTRSITKAAFAGLPVTTLDQATQGASVLSVLTGK